MAGRFFDTTVVSEGIPHDKATLRAEQWLHDVETKTHRLLSEWPLNLSNANRPSSVRIAVLDTGVDIKNKSIQAEFGRLGRIRGWKHWDDTGNTPDTERDDSACDDCDGHGTHVTALLLRTAVKAHIYVARVAERKQYVSAVSVEKAIRHATFNWKVDIISLSLGFDADQPAMVDAINEAQRRNIIIFAAASNNGNNGPVNIAFPARLRNVICVCASNGYGTALADFNPTMEERSDYFATLGVAVPSAWPERLHQSGRMSLSGTSMATPILSGSCALALHFLRQQVIDRPATFHPDKFWSWLANYAQSTDGVSSLLDAMSDKHHKSMHYVAPWLLLDVGREGNSTDVRTQIAAQLWDRFKLNFDRRDTDQGLVRSPTETLSEHVDFMLQKDGFWLDRRSHLARSYLGLPLWISTLLVLSLVFVSIATLFGEASIPGLGRGRIQYDDPVPPSVMHLPRNNHFVGRTEVLGNLDNALGIGPDVRKAALTGLGGIGKSQIALEYSYRVRERLPSTAVYWVSASDPRAFRRDYMAIARTLDLLTGSVSTDPLTLVSEWLSDPKNGPWLMVLDNADNTTFVIGDDYSGQENCAYNDNSDIQMIAATYLPFTGNGSLLFTTQNETLAHILTDNMPGKVIRVDGFRPDEARDLVALKLPAGRVSDDEADVLIQQLEYIPLAIAQAIAYLIQRPRTEAKQYISWLYDDHACQSLLSTANGELRHDTTGLKAVLKTWQVSMNRIQITSPAALKLLAQMSILDRQSIPAYLWTGPSDLYREDHIQMCSYDRYPDMNQFDFEINIAVLLDFALVEQQKDPQLFSIHRLVQLATKAWLLNDYVLAEAQKDMLGQLAAKYPQTDIFLHDKAMSETLDPHSQAVLDLKLKGQDEEQDEALLWWRRGMYFVSSGRLSEAHRALEKARQLLSTLLGPEHHSTMTSTTHLVYAQSIILNWLPVLAQDLDHDVMNELAAEVFEARIRLSGPCHPATINMITMFLDLRHYDKHQELISSMMGSLQELSHSCPDKWKEFPTISTREWAAHLKLLSTKAEISLESGDHEAVVDILETAGHMVNLGRAAAKSVAAVDILETAGHMVSLGRAAVNSIALPEIKISGADSVILIHLGQPDEYQAKVQTCIALAREQLGVHSVEMLFTTKNLVFALTQLGHTDEAIAVVEQVLSWEETVQSNWYATYRLLLLSMRTSRIEELLEQGLDLERAQELWLAAQPTADDAENVDAIRNSPYQRWILAFLLWEGDKKKESLDVMREAAKLSADKNQSALAYFQAKHQYAQAIAAYEQAETDGDSGAAERAATLAYNISNSEQLGETRLNSNARLLLVRLRWSQQQQQDHAHLLPELLSLSGWSNISDEAMGLLDRYQLTAHTFYRGLKKWRLAEPPFVFNASKYRSDGDASMGLEETWSFLPALLPILGIWLLTALDAVLAALWSLFVDYLIIVLVGLAFVLVRPLWQSAPLHVTHNITAHSTLALANMTRL